MSEIPNANSKTGMEGEVLIGTAVIVSNAKRSIRRLPANATARPKAPPSKESTRLSVKARSNKTHRLRAQGHTQRHLLASLQAAHKH